MGKSKSPKKGKRNSKPKKKSKKNPINDDLKNAISANSGKETSKVWPEFTKVNADGYVFCKRCLKDKIKKPYLKSAGTKSPKNHLENIHGVFVNAQSIPWSKERNEKAQEILLKMLAIDMKSVNSFLTPSVKSFLFVLNRNFKVPCAETIRKRMLELKEKIKRELVVELNNEANVGLSCTTDLWDNMSNEHFLTVTGHYINQEWILKKKELFTEKMPGAVASGEVLEQMIQKCFDELKIEGDTVIFVSDGGKNLQSALKDKNHVYCMAHLSNLILEDCSPIVDPLMTKTKTIVKVFKKSYKATEVLMENQVRNPPLHLINYVKTRWNTNNNMAERLLILYSPVERTLVELNKHIQVRKKDKSRVDIRFKKQELVDLKCFVECTNPFKIITTFLEGDQYVTASLRVKLMEKLYGMLLNLNFKEQSTLVEKYRLYLLTSFDARIKKFDDCYIIAFFCDPRFKVDTEFLKKEDIIKIVTKQFQKLKKKIAENKEPNHTPMEEEEENEDGDEFDDGDEFEEFGYKPAKKMTIEEVLGGSSQVTGKKSGGNEIDNYMMEPKVDIKTNPLDWWRQNQRRFPILAILARRFLCIPATSASSERVWSAAGNIYSKKRCRLHPETACAQLFLHNNLDPLMEHLPKEDMRRYIPESIIGGKKDAFEDTTSEDEGVISNSEEENSSDSSSEDEFMDNDDFPNDEEKEDVERNSGTTFGQKERGKKSKKTIGPNLDSFLEKVQEPAESTIFVDSPSPSRNHSLTSSPIPSRNHPLSLSPQSKNDSFRRSSASPIHSSPTIWSRKKSSPKHVSSLETSITDAIELESPKKTIDEESSKNALYEEFSKNAGNEESSKNVGNEESSKNAGKEESSKNVGNEESSKTVVEPRSSVAFPSESGTNAQISATPGAETRTRRKRHRVSRP